MTLAEYVRNAGVVGAGGAGFPAHVKVASQVEYIIANGAECEPLMHKDAELMAHYAHLIIVGMQAVMSSTGAKKGIIGIKNKHPEAIEALTHCASGTGIDLHILGDFYPAGDEFVLVYETTGRLIPPGGIPLQVGVVVQNVETLYNIAKAMEGVPVTHKFLTVAGAVKNPISVAAPVGMAFRELIHLAGGTTENEIALLVGGAMMGRLTRNLDECVTKTTGGIIALPAHHNLVLRQERPESQKHQIGKSACDQCSYCTELCPRYLLGYAIEPHKVMRSLVFSMSGADFWNRWGMLCCECGLCTLYACPEDLFPREACQKSKREAKEKNISWTPDLAAQTPSMKTELHAHPMYESRRIPVKQLVQRLGLTAYDVPAPLVEIKTLPTRIQLPLKQHAGAPAQPVVAIGDRISAGDLVASMPDKTLGASIHSSISGTVRHIHPDIVIEA